MSSNSTWETIGGNVRYNKAELLGEGGFGRVYGGKYFKCPTITSLTVVHVAVKKMFKNATDLEEREIAIHRKLQHEHVIKLLFHDQDVESLYLVLEKAVCSLKDLLEEKENSDGIQLSTDEILEQTTLGLEHIHSMDIIHRDVKLSNFLICVYNGEDVIKIADFGISKNLDPDKTSCTNSRAPFTKGYSACEILRNQRARKGSDIFSLGIVFFKVFQPNHHPFGDNDIDIAVNIRDKEDPDLELLDADDEDDDIDDTYKQIIEHMISHESTDRLTATQIAVYLYLLESGYDWEESNIHRNFEGAYRDLMKQRKRRRNGRVSK